MPRLVEGRSPADLPIQQPTKFEFVVNLEAANQIDLTILLEEYGRRTTERNSHDSREATRGSHALG
jgi:ABC-type uncharacterized transport system substrate-binding protein